MFKPINKLNRIVVIVIVLIKTWSILICLIIEVDLFAILYQFALKDLCFNFDNHR